MTRRPLPSRRQCDTREINWQAPDGALHQFTVSVGFDEAGTPREVFCGHAKGAMFATLADACTIISIALQNDIPPGALAKSIGRMPMYGQDVPASPIGAIVAEIIAAGGGATE